MMSHSNPTSATWGTKLRAVLSTLADQSAKDLPLHLRAIVAALRRANNHAAQRIFASVARPFARTSERLPRQALRMLLIKPVSDACNLACRYCYESGRREQVTQSNMSESVLRQILYNVLPYVEPPFAIYLHGGEPLLRGQTFFNSVVSHLRDFSATDWVSIGVQTNATLIDKSWAEFFRDNGINVGISLDGGRLTHDTHRVTHSGLGSFDYVVRGINVLQEAGISFGTTCVLTPGFLSGCGQGTALLDEFFALGIREFDVEPAYSADSKSGQWNISPTAYASFMIALFEAWLVRGDPNLVIRSFEHFFQGMTGVGADACDLSGRCTTVLAVDPSGEAIKCTRPFQGRFTFGNLAVQTLPDLMHGDVFQSFRSLDFDAQQRTDGCRWSRLCGRGGCPHNRRSDVGQAVDGINIYCTCFGDGEGGYPALFEHIRSRVEEILGEHATCKIE